MAALAAGVATSMAQNVYSLNIVGYANVPTPVGFTFQTNPFDTGTNGALQVIPNPGDGINPTALDGSEIHEWIGTGFKVSVFDSLTDDTSTGFTTRAGAATPAPVLSSAKGYLFNNAQATSNNITYVGTVRTGTNTVTFPVSGLPVATGSPIPYAGNPAALGFTNTGDGINPTALDGCEIETLVRAPNGNAQGFLVRVFDSLTDDTTTGFTDRGGSPQPAPQLAVGQGFFFNNTSASPVTWTQVLNP
jgi:hypothetical protein